MIEKTIRASCRGSGPAQAPCWSAQCSNHMQHVHGTPYCMNCCLPLHKLEVFGALGTPTAPVLILILGNLH